MVNAVKELITIYSENHTKPRGTSVRKNVELLIIKEAVHVHVHCALNN